MSILEDDLRSLEKDPCLMGKWDRALRTLGAARLNVAQLESIGRRLVAMRGVPGGYCEPRRREMLAFIEVRIGRRLAPQPATQWPKQRPSPKRQPPPEGRPSPVCHEEDVRLRIKREVERRGIATLLHFTRTTNLAMIGVHGILPKAELDRKRIPYRANDARRLDGAPGACSVSIGWPNWQMFYHYRQEEPEETWAVVEITPDLLWKANCAFCWTNAANNLMRPVPLTDMKNFRAFTGMFIDHPDRPLRSRCQLDQCCPTDPQAEVLVFGPIPLEKIRTVHTDRRLPPGSVPALLAPRVVLDGMYFGPRHDYAQWRRKLHNAEDGGDRG